MRVTANWDKLHLQKGESALAFEARWEDCHRDLEEVGLACNATEKYLKYIIKVGPPISETIRMDKRPRKTADPEHPGEFIYPTRAPETWEEAHAVLVEVEGVPDVHNLGIGRMGDFLQRGKRESGAGGCSCRAGRCKG